MTSDSKPTHEIEVFLRFTIDEEAWALEYGLHPAEVARDVSELLNAPELKEAIEDSRILGPLVTKLDSVKVRVGKGPRAISTES